MGNLSIDWKLGKKLYTGKKILGGWGRGGGLAPQEPIRSSTLNNFTKINRIHIQLGKYLFLANNAKPSKARDGYQFGYVIFLCDFPCKRFLVHKVHISCGDIVFCLYLSRATSGSSLNLERIWMLKLTEGWEVCANHLYKETLPMKS